MTVLSLNERYVAAMNRMQSAVAFDLIRRLGLDAEPHFIEPEAFYRALKDVRVGVNSSLSSNGALSSLLLKKGVITESEYMEELTSYVEREADLWTKTVCEKYELPEGTNFA